MIKITTGTPNQAPARPPDFYSTKSCAQQFTRMVESLPAQKRRRSDAGPSASTEPATQLVSKLTFERIAELETITQQHRTQYKKIKKEMEAIENGQLDHQLPAMIEDAKRQLGAEKWATIVASVAARRVPSPSAMLPAPSTSEAAIELTAQDVKGVLRLSKPASEESGGTSADDAGLRSPSPLSHIVEAGPLILSPSSAPVAHTVEHINPQKSPSLTPVSNVVAADVGSLPLSPTKSPAAHVVFNIGASHVSPSKSPLANVVEVPAQQISPSKSPRRRQSSRTAAVDRVPVEETSQRDSDNSSSDDEPLKQLVKAGSTAVKEKAKEAVASEVGGRIVLTIKTPQKSAASRDVVTPRRRREPRTGRASEDVAPAPPSTGRRRKTVATPQVSRPETPQTPDIPPYYATAEEYKNWKKAVLLFLRETLRAHKWSNIFWEPVTEDVAAGYSDIVRRPMDLGTMRKMIEQGQITSSEEFHRALLLMFANAVMYNNADHDVHLMAREMHVDVETQMKDFMKSQERASSLSNAACGVKSLRSRDTATGSADEDMSVTATRQTSPDSDDEQATSSSTDWWRDR